MLSSDFLNYCKYDPTYFRKINESLRSILNARNWLVFHLGPLNLTSIAWNRWIDSVSGIRSISSFFILFSFIQYLALVAIVCKRNWTNRRWWASCVHIQVTSTTCGSMQSRWCTASSNVGWTIFEWHTIPSRVQPAIRRASRYVSPVGRPQKQWNGLTRRTLSKTTTSAPITRTLWTLWLRKAINAAKTYSVHRTISAKGQVSPIENQFPSSFGPISLITILSTTDENKAWFHQLDALIRYVYALNEDTPVTFVAHSMGGRMLLHFLQQMPPDYKSKFVRKVITLNTPWGGSVQSVEAVSMGYSFGSSVLDALKMRTVQRSSPSVMWLMPSEHFWKPTEVFATTNQKNYSRSNLNEFFEYVSRCFTSTIGRIEF